MIQLVTSCVIVLCTCSTGSGEYHIISCGDDGSVAVTTLLLDVSSTSDELSVTHHEVSIEPYAHSSCCTGWSFGYIHLN